MTDFSLTWLILNGGLVAQGEFPLQPPCGSPVSHGATDPSRIRGGQHSLANERPRPLSRILAGGHRSGAAQRGTGGGEGGGRGAAAVGQGIGRGRGLRSWRAFVDADEPGEIIFVTICSYYA